MDRRETLKIALTAAGLGIIPVSCTHHAQLHRSQWGVQLYTVRDLMEVDPVGTVRKLTAMGYSKFEFFRTGYYGIEPGRWKALLSDFGATSPSRIVRLDHLRGDLERTMDEAEAIGHSHLVLAYLHQSERQSMAQYRELFGFLADVGASMPKRGLRFGYHHHRFEFEGVDGEIPFDAMLTEVPTEEMGYTLDTYHMVRAGRDPLDFLARHPGRFEQLHIKDIAADGVRMVPAGAGTIDFRAILTEFPRSQFLHAYIEHDGPERGLEIAQTAFKYLRRLSPAG